MESLEWALNQYDLCPYKKGNFGHRNARGGKIMARDRSVQKDIIYLNFKDEEMEIE